MTPKSMLLTASLAILPGVALADGEVQKLMTAADKTRLAGFDQTRETALREATPGSPTDRAVLDGLVVKKASTFSGFDLTGDWQCRTIKVGGPVNFVVYGWFKCSVTDDGSGWMLAKTTGSQRTTGRFYDDGETRLIYLGSFSVNDDPVMPYGSGADTDQVGYAFRTGPEAWRIEMPAPRYESKLDVIELKR